MKTRAAALLRKFGLTLFDAASNLRGYELMLVATIRL